MKDMKDTKELNIKLGKNFIIKNQIGKGSFGEIFEAINTINNEKVAVKLEQKNSRQPQLHYETKIYHYLNQDKKFNTNGIARLYGYGTDKEYNYMSIEILGNSLEKQFESQNKKFSIKTTCMIAIQCIKRVEYLHSKYLLHRDLKPDNFTMGKNEKKYITKEYKHIPYKDGKNLTGTARYASINTHMGIEQSRRDDLESLAYIFIYFIKSYLPWMNQPGNTQKEKYDNISRVKSQTPEDVLCKGIPDEFKMQQFFIRYLKYCKSLQFEDKPDYSYCVRLFETVLQRKNYKFDYKYDWLVDDTSTQESNPQQRFQAPGLNHQLYPQNLQKKQIQQNQQNQLSQQYLVQQNPQQSQQKYFLPQLKNTVTIYNTNPQKQLQNETTLAMMRIPQHQAKRVIV